LNGYKTWPLALNEEHRVRVFDNRVLRIIFGPKRDEATGGCRKLHNETHNLYSSPNVVRIIRSRMMRRLRHISHTGENRNAHKTFVGNPEGKRQLARPWSRLADNIKMDLKRNKFGGRGLDLSGSGWGR
jgi:hypothetical protein